MRTVQIYICRREGEARRQRTGGQFPRAPAAPLKNSGAYCRGEATGPARPGRRAAPRGNLPGRRDSCLPRAHPGYLPSP